MRDRPSLKLREATVGDSYALWLWANDSETRAAAFDRAAIRWTEHVQWLHSQLKSRFALVFIAENEAGQPVGSVRFDTVDAWKTARLSYVVAPEARGTGAGTVLVTLGVEELWSRHPAAGVHAEVRQSNSRSRHIFEELSWQSKPGDRDNLVFEASKEQPLIPVASDRSSRGD